MDEKKKPDQSNKNIKDQKPKVKIVDPNAKPAQKEPIAPWKQN